MFIKHQLLMVQAEGHVQRTLGIRKPLISHHSVEGSVFPEDFLRKQLTRKLIADGGKVEGRHMHVNSR